MKPSHLGGPGLHFLISRPYSLSFFLETLALFLLVLLQFPVEVEGGGVWPLRTALPIRALIRPGACRGGAGPWV